MLGLAATVISGEKYFLVEWFKSEGKIDFTRQKLTLWYCKRLWERAFINVYYWRKLTFFSYSAVMFTALTTDDLQGPPQSCVCHLLTLLLFHFAPEDSSIRLARLLTNNLFFFFKQFSLPGMLCFPLSFWLKLLFQIFSPVSPSQCILFGPSYLF